YATPPLRSDAAPTTTGRPPRDGPWGRGCAEPGCASQPQPGRPWFDGVLIRISREDVEEAVDDALDSLPQAVARAIAAAIVASLGTGRGGGAVGSRAARHSRSPAAHGSMAS